MLFHDLLDLVFPRSCVGCRTPGPPFCAECRPSGTPHRVDAEFDVIAAGQYVAALRAGIVAYKEHGRRDVGPMLAALLAAAAAEVAGSANGRDRRAPVLVAVPSRRAAVAARGGNHVERLARRCAPAIGCRVAPSAVRLVRTVRDSAGLGISARHANMAGAMRAAPGEGRCAIVVDDIVTTGATLAETRRALTAAGWRVLGGAVVADTPRLFPPAHDSRPAAHRRVPSDPLALPR